MGLSGIGFHRHIHTQFVEMHHGNVKTVKQSSKENELDVLQVITITMKYLSDVIWKSSMSKGFGKWDRTPWCFHCCWKVKRRLRLKATQAELVELFILHLRMGSKTTQMGTSVSWKMLICSNDRGGKKQQKPYYPNFIQQQLCDLKQSWVTYRSLA